jgi:hypothetical protein
MYRESEQLRQRAFGESSLKLIEERIERCQAL